MLRILEIAMRDFRVFEIRDPVTRDRSVLLPKRWILEMEKTLYLIMRWLIRDTPHETDLDS